MRLRNHYLKQMKRLSENKKLINIMQRTIKMIGSIKYQVKKILLIKFYIKKKMNLEEI
jgi:hypothetical protein